MTNDIIQKNKVQEFQNICTTEKQKPAQMALGQISF